MREFLTLYNQKLLEEITWYLVEIFSLYNDTNKRMQGAEATVKECKETVGAFEYMRNKLEKENLRPPANGTVGGKLPDALGRQFTDHIEELHEVTNSRLSDVWQKMPEWWTLTMSSWISSQILSWGDSTLNGSSGIRAVLACERTGHRSKTCTSLNHQIPLGICHNMPVRGWFQRSGHHQNEDTQQAWCTQWLPFGCPHNHTWHPINGSGDTGLERQAAWTIKTYM